MTENDHALDLYYILKQRFDTAEHPLTAWSIDSGKMFCYMQETVKEEDGYEFFCLQNRSSRVNLYVVSAKYSCGFSNLMNSSMIVNGR